MIEVGDSDTGYCAGDRLRRLPDDWYCLALRVGKDMFVKME